MFETSWRVGRVADREVRIPDHRQRPRREHKVTQVVAGARTNTTIRTRARAWSLTAAVPVSAEEQP